MTPLRVHLLGLSLRVRAGLLGAGVLLLLGLAAATRAQTDTRAHDLATRLADAMGGRTRWDNVACLRFDWVVEVDGHEVARARHLWDRRSGHYRVEWKSRDGHEVKALFDTGTRRGRAWVDGARVSGADSTKWLEKAYGRFINDSYWLLMPWKLEDPGTHLEYAGEKQLDGQTYDLVHVRFDSGVGLTSGDQYWAYLNRTTHRMDRWAYFLEDMKGEPGLDHATVWSWSDWREVGGVWFAADRVVVGGEKPSRIHFPVLACLPDAGKLFDSVDQPLPDR